MLVGPEEAGDVGEWRALAVLEDWGLSKDLEGRFGVERTQGPGLGERRRLVQGLVGLQPPRRVWYRYMVRLDAVTAMVATWSRINCMRWSEAA